MRSAKAAWWYGSFSLLRRVRSCSESAPYSRCFCFSASLAHAPPLARSRCPAPNSEAPATLARLSAEDTPHHMEAIKCVVVGTCCW